MNGFFKNPVVAFLSSLKLSAFLMAVVAISSARATFIESRVGRDGAYDLVYAATWFEIVLGLLTISLMLLFFRRWPYKPKQLGFAFVHVAIVVILIGSAMTRYMGYEGLMRIREGETVDYIYSDKDHIQATLGNQTASFPVRLWKPDANDIWQKIVLQGQEYELGVTEYWPHFTEVYQEGPGGPAGFNYRVVGHDHDGGHVMREGEKATIGAAEARFVSGGEFGGPMSTSPYGDLRVNIDGEPCAFPLDPRGNTPMACNGYTFRLAEYQTAFKVGGEPNLDGPMTNPMVKVAITAPDGSTGERILFAYHPDFSMGHSGGEDDFPGLNLMFQVSRGIEFTTGGETGIRARASFDLVGMDMGNNEEFALPAGEPFALRERVVYRDDSGDVSFAPMRIMTSVVLAPAHSENANNRAAARIVLRDASGNQVDAICMEQDRPQTVSLNGQTFELAYGPTIRRLPYAVRLDDFVLDTYPGSDNPATYESYVTLIDPEQGIEGEQVHIYMNHPLDHRGSRHFQSSYDTDRRGTILSVNHDPGKWPTYFGYFLISLGFILIFAKDLLFKSAAEKKKARAEKAAATVGALALVAVLAGAAPVQAQDDGHNHDHAPAASGFVKLSGPARDLASRLVVQDFRGRMKPLDTMARETVIKVTKMPANMKFEGRESVDLYLNWTMNPTFWWDKDLIYLGFPGLNDVLGVSADTKRVSAASLFDAQGRYRLADLAAEAHRTPDRDRTKLQRKLISFDERFNILYMTFRGQMLSIYPVPGHDNDKWLDYQQVEKQLTPEQVAEYQPAFAALLQGLQSGSDQQIMDGLRRTDALQHKYGASVLPSQAVLGAELFYNKANIWFYTMMGLLVPSAILMILYLVNLFRNAGRPFTWRNPVYALGMGLYLLCFAAMIVAYIARWIASERIPISNGHESLLFISLAIAASGLIFDFKYRMAAPASLGAFLTAVILGVSTLSTFDPAIGPLVPVLVSYWLNIHVTIITSSYGFLGLSALIGTLILFLTLLKGPHRENVRDAIKTLDNINKHVLITGLGLLTVGTLLGGVWANESWGRYWGWDAKETWSLITILVYAVVLHFRWIPAMRSVWLNSAASLAAVSSVVMTYFGVNYFLTGLHSYAQGDAAKVPDWVFIGTGLIIALITVSGIVNKTRSWGDKKAA
ncbi:cytochrome c biogenesis protein CcsA [bacterium]|nr:cytochrome c biogenesis protein CcsA [bacterium]